MQLRLLSGASYKAAQKISTLTVMSVHCYSHCDDLHRMNSTSNQAIFVLHHMAILQPSTKHKFTVVYTHYTRLTIIENTKEQ